MDNFIISKICTVMEYSTDETHWISNNRPHHILAYQSSGFYFHYFQNSSLLIKPDTFFFINQKDFFRVERTISGGTSLVIHFTTEQEIQTPSFGMNCNTNPKIKNDFYKLLNMWKSKEQTHFSCYSLMYKLLDSLKVSTEKPYIAPQSQKNMESVAAELELHFAEKIKNEELSKKFGISTRYLNKQFHKQYGITPNQYLINYRIIKAMDLLSKTDLKIEQISLQTGFQDPYYFSKFFKRQTGYSPSLFRKINAEKTILQ